MEYKKTVIPSKINISNIVTLHRVEAKPTLHHNHMGEAHDFPELVYVASGENNVMIDGVCQTVREGEAVIFAPMSYHSGSDKSSALTLYIISFDVLEPLPEGIYNHAISLTAKQKSVISEIFSTGLELFSKVPPNGKEKGMFFNGKGNDASLQVIKNNLELLLLSMLEKLTADSENTPADEKMRVIEYLNKSLGKNLTLDEISQACSMSTSRLKRMFNGGVINYFNRLKIKAACDMIRNENKNFTQIAEELGFSSIHYFSRLFKSTTGMTPSEYKSGQ